jgi:hypothetical protein
MRMVLMRCEEETGENVREVAITLVREPEEAQDVIRPKRTGVGITFETVNFEEASPKSGWPTLTINHPIFPLRRPVRARCVLALRNRRA